MRYNRRAARGGARTSTRVGQRELERGQDERTKSAASRPPEKVARLAFLRLFSLLSLPPTTSHRHHLSQISPATPLLRQQVLFRRLDTTEPPRRLRTTREDSDTEGLAQVATWRAALVVHTLLIRLVPSFASRLIARGTRGVYVSRLEAGCMRFGPGPAARASQRQQRRLRRAACEETKARRRLLCPWISSSGLRGIEGAESRRESSRTTRFVPGSSLERPLALAQK